MSYNFSVRHLLPYPYIIVIFSTLVSYLLIYGMKRLLCIKLSRFFGKSQTKWDLIVVRSMEHTTHFFMLTCALFIGLHFVDLKPNWNLYAFRFFFVVLMIQIGIWSNYLLETYISTTISRKTRRNPSAANSISLIHFASKVILISVVFLFTLNNLGIKITTILAGLGVGGLAVALAVQKILGDLFSSLSIVLDKPFMVGDFIVVNEFLGEVEKIGLKTTRIRSLSGEQIIISNSDLLASRIRNYERMHERRVALKLALTHQCSSEELQNAVSYISTIIENEPHVRLERCHLMEIGLSSLNIETIYWVLNNDYDNHMDIQQSILLKVHQAFSQANLKFAHPTQTLHVSPTELLMKTSPMEDQKNERPTQSMM